MEEVLGCLVRPPGGAEGAGHAAKGLVHEGSPVERPVATGLPHALFDGVDVGGRQRQLRNKSIVVVGIAPDHLQERLEEPLGSRSVQRPPLGSLAENGLQVVEVIEDDDVTALVDPPRQQC